MHYQHLSIDGAWSATPRQHVDDRGAFMEWFTSGSFADATGHPLTVAQANLSVSTAGVIRGIHFADVPPGQGKYVTCLTGAVADVVVDIRVGSPTYGTWEIVILDDVDRRVLYIGEGLGHAFMALDDGSAVAYLCSTPFTPEREHGINPRDPDLGIAWPTVDRSGAPIVATLSDKDRDAPSLAEAEQAGLLPRYDDVVAFRASLAASTLTQKDR